MKVKSFLKPDKNLFTTFWETFSTDRQTETKITFWFAQIIQKHLKNWYTKAMLISKLYLHSTAVYLPVTTTINEKHHITRNVGQCQRDGRPAEYRWRPLFNAAKFGWRPLLECHAVTLPRRETGWNLQGCPKLMKWSQPLVGKVHHIMGTCGGHIAA